MDQCNYCVVFEDYTKNHYIKTFRKKYSDKVWGVTQDAIKEMCGRIDNLYSTNLVDRILQKENCVLCKLDFSVAKTKESPKSSGNRCILLVDESLRSVRVLLVYSKNDVRGNHETQWWKAEVFGEYDDVRQIFK